jgi:N-acetylneuraminic acid mutarotase
LSSVESYTESTGDWTRASPLPQALYAEAAVADTGGHLFTFGGAGAGGAPTNAVYEYTIATNTWSTAAPLPFAVRDAAAVLGSNGRIYVLGGKTTGGTTAAVESFDPTANAWTVEDPLPAPVSSAAVASDSLGRIELLGGFDAAGTATANVWISQRLNQPDAAPLFRSSPLTYTGTGRLYTYQVFTDANPQAAYALTAAPAGMTINAFTGQISWMPTAAQAGTFPVTVQASNAAGTLNQSFNVVVAQSPPTAPSGLTVTGTTASSVTLAWNPSTSPVGVASYTVYLVTTRGHSGRGGGITTVYTPVGTTTSTSFTVGNLYPGSYRFAVKAYDVNNVASGYSIVYTASPLPDTTPPVLTLPANQTIAATSAAGATDPAAITATANDPGPGLDRITVSYAVGAYPADNTYVFPLGVTTVTVTARDLSNNLTTGTFTVTVLNPNGPTLIVPANQVVEATSAAGAADPGAFNVTVLGANPTVGFAVGPTPINSSYVFPLGVTMVSVTATDPTGTTTGTFTVTVRDTTAPTLTLPGYELRVEATSAAGATDPAAFTATATDAVTANPTIAYDVGGVAVDSTYVFPLGYTPLTVTAKDAAGNVVTGSFYVVVQDTTPPTLHLPPNQTVVAASAAGATDPAAFTATATDTVTAIPSITYYLGANPIGTGNVFPLGTTTVTAVAVDAAGNSTSGDFTVSVVNDPAAPTLSVPANQTVEAMSANGATDAAAFTATASSPVTPNPPIAYAAGTIPLTSSHVFPLGVTTVTVTATDANGRSSYGTFTVTVQDTTAPTLTVPPWQTVQATSAAGASDAGAFTATATDAVTANPTIAYTVNGSSIDSTYVFPVGTTVVTVSATDAAGNTSTGSFVVTVDGSGLPTGVTWSAGVGLPAARADAAAYKLGTSIYVFGGTTAAGEATAVLQGDGTSAWATNPVPLDPGIVSPAVAETYNVGPRVSSDEGGSVYKYPSDLYIYGGSNGGVASDTMLNYFPFEPAQQPGTGAATVRAPSMSTARAALAYVSDPATGQLYAIGGLDQHNTALATVERFTSVPNSGPPPAESWSTLAPLPQPRYGASAFADGLGHLFVIGGDNGTGAPVATVYRYTIATNTWDTVAPLPMAASFMAGALAPDGLFLVAGGTTAAGATADVWAYSPGANTWAAETPLPAPVSGAAGAIHSHGNLEVIGGYDAQQVPVATVFVGANLPAAVPTHLAIAQPPPASVTTTQQVTVDVGVEDAASDVVAVSGTVNVLLVGPDGSSAASATLSLVNGLASYSFNAGDYGTTNPGVYTLHFSDDPLTATAVSLAIGTSSAPVVPHVTVVGGTFTYDAAAHTATATALGTDGVTPVSGSFSFTYNGSSVAPTDAGTYAVVATFTSSDAHYAGTVADGSITIAPATPALTLTTGTFAHDGLAHPASLTAAGVDGVTPVSGIDNITYNGSATPPTDPGSYAVAATFVSTNPDYHNATATGTLTIAISGSATTVTVQGGTFTYDGAAHLATAAAVAADGVTPVSGTFTFTYNGATTVPTAAGTYAIVATFTSADPTFPSATGTGTVVIRPAIPAVTVGGGPFTSDGTAHTATATATGVGNTGVAGTYAITYNGSAAVPSAPGAYTVVATFTSSDPNYANATGSGTLVINPPPTPPPPPPPPPVTEHGGRAHKHSHGHVRKRRPHHGAAHTHLPRAADGIRRSVP